MANSKQLNKISIAGMILFILVMCISKFLDIDMEDDFFWFLRILTALSAAAISTSIPGELKVETFEDKSGKRIVKNFADKFPKITASGAIAVFVLVYLLEPIDFNSLNS
ncbi:hypothetical protein AAON49_07070 [Pseudotenacibaculum sp. MALMAid0570]|uniref:hypothetical protein n=1 Tax=Pseudotenacibaculum sp. MALMAid0570 TaxID=3143938 RepID=UPI0032DEEA6C